MFAQFAVLCTVPYMCYDCLYNNLFRYITNLVRSGVRVLKLHKCVPSRAGILFNPLSLFLGIKSRLMQTAPKLFAESFALLSFGGAAYSIVRAMTGNR